MRTRSGLQFRRRQHRDALLVQPLGVLDLAGYADLRDALLKAAADEPSAVIVDVGELTMSAAHSLTVFTSVGMRVAEWPGVPILLVAPEPAQFATLAGSPVARYVRVYRDLSAALEAVDKPPPRRRDRLTLSGAAASSGIARDFVRTICARWNLTQAMAEDASAVATELVENVIEHTVSSAELRVELRASGLSVAVTDGDPRPAVLREAVGPGALSAGLAIVAQLSRAWGCFPTARGKTVWAVLSIP